MIGQTISHYRILEKLGEGGMGIVYKAEDIQLKRTVALKFLPDRVNKDAAAKERFLQEAQAAAALNHPNICTIYGVEDVDGSLFIAMEYIEGGTLREKIPFSKIDDAIMIAAQIGEALQEAHSKGIVHRDIKADNIMLTSKGQTKVMDFGLAKLKGSLKLTKTSSTVGTLAYMAPEQIQGGEVNHRSDIFSFGVLLFEMLTGKLPFRGEHEAAMMYSIVNEEPQDIGTIIPLLSPLVVNLVQRCLEKDPADRYQTMEDAVSELRRSQKKTSRVVRQQTTEFDRAAMLSESVARPASTENTHARSLLTNRSFLSIAGAGFLVAVAALSFWLFRHSSVQLNPNATTRVLEIPLTDLEYHGLSGDGNWVAFAAKDTRGKQRIYLMNTGGGEPKAVVADSMPYIRGVDISRDGSYLTYYGSTTGNLSNETYVVSSLGGEPRTISSKAFMPRWRPDAQRIFFFQRRDFKDPTTPGLDLRSITPEGTDERLEFRDTLSSISNARFSFSPSPDGGSIAWLRTFPDGAYQEVIITDLKSGTEHQITFNKKKIDEVCWARNDQIIFSTDKGGNANLWMIPASGGDQVQITKGPGPDLGIHISDDLKKLVYYENQDIEDLWVTSLRTGESQQMTFDEKPKWSSQLSPDGTSIAYVVIGFDPIQGQGKSFTLYMSRRDGTNRRQVFSSSYVIDYEKWSPDGKHLAFFVATNASGDSTNVYVGDVDRPGSPRFIGPGQPFTWLDADKLLMINAHATWIVSLTSGSREKFFQDSTTAFPVPGGTHVYYRDTRKGREGRWAVSVDKSFKPNGMPKRILDPVEVKFSPGRDFLLYQKPDASIWKVSLPDGRQERVRNLSFDAFELASGSVNPRTDEFVYVKRRNKGRLVMIENLFK
jgi:serine/threonine protein kinase